MIASLIFTIIGLSLFEIINSVDNAVINAEVLGTMSAKSRQWFLLWGLIFAVFLVRGLLPLTIVWITNPTLGILDILSAAFTSDPNITHAIEASAPVLLSGAGIFLIFLFLHWLFLEPKVIGLHTERFFEKHSVWFYAVVSIILSVIVWFSIQRFPMMAFGVVVGSTAFFITHGFKESAEKIEHDMLHKKGLSDWSKILYLEVINATFSIDSVLGAFAFTLSVPLILIGNGIGAIVVRQLTVGNIDRVKKYPLVKNGAMYSILFLGAIMIADAFGAHIPAWFSPVITFTVLGFFVYKSPRL